MSLDSLIIIIDRNIIVSKIKCKSNTDIASLSGLNSRIVFILKHLFI